jgi:hypothetical protein
VFVTLSLPYLVSITFPFLICRSGEALSRGTRASELKLLFVVSKLQGTRDRPVSWFLSRLIGIGCNSAMFGLALVATLPCLRWLACNARHLKARRESSNGHCLPLPPPPPCTSRAPIQRLVDRNFRIPKPILRHQTGPTGTGQGENLLLGNGPNPARVCNT